MLIGIVKEPAGENRVSLLPESAGAILKLNVSVAVENTAGESAAAVDDNYRQAGAEVKSRNEILSTSDVICCIHPLPQTDIELLKSEAVLCGAFQPAFQKEFILKCSEKRISVFSLDMIPRTTRAQSMDVLSSQATAAGYKAVLLAASHLPKFFPLFMTAAGSITPAKVLVLGAGVAGLQAISTSRRLGAIVEAFDVRAAAGEEVRSLGAKFIEVEGAAENKAAGGYAVEQGEEFKRRQADLIHEHAVKADVVICTAQIPGRKAPQLLTMQTVQNMKPGSVIIDMAASTGGNCEGSKNNETVIVNGVRLIGNSSLASTIPADASKMFGKNMVNFLKLMISNASLQLNFNDDLIQGCCITHAGEIVNARIKETYSTQPA